MEKSEKESQFKISVFYDGLCQLCSREIDHYRKMRGAEQIQFVDITASDFNAEALGLDPLEVHRNLHAKDAGGKLYVGVDSFILIWSHLEALKRVACVAKWFPVKKSLDFGYAAFTRVRPLLPRKKCADSPYCEL